MATMLDAVINLKDNFSSTIQTVEKNIGSLSRTSRTMGRDIQRTGKTVSAIGGSLTKSLTVPLLGMGAGAVKVGMQFESSMSEVAATMGITVDEIKNGSENFKLLEDAAKKMGRETQYSASESAEALNYLALAGYDAEGAVEMLPKVLNLAAAGGLELAYASDMVTDSMSALGLSTRQADIFIDEMAKTAQSSNTNVAQLGEAILMVGANGRDLANGTLELTTAIGLLGNAGIKGAEAGTKLRNIIMAMNPTTDKAVAAFKKMKVSSYDANGNLRPLNETLVDMSKSMQGLTMKEKQDIMGGIFNKQDMAAAATLLASVTQSTEDLDYALAEMGISTKGMNMNLDDLIPKMSEFKDEQDFVRYAIKNFGATAEEAKTIYSGLQGIMGDTSAWDDLEGKIGNAKGTAQEMADTLMYNLKGAFTKIKSALEGVGIKIYKVLKPSLEDAASFIQKLIDKINNLTPEQMGLISKFVKLAIVLGPILMLIGGLTSKVGGAVTEFGYFAARVKNLGLKAAILTPGAKVVLVLGAIVGVAILVYKNWDKIKAAADKLIERFPIITDVANVLKDALVFMKDKVIELKDKFLEFKDKALVDVKEKFTDFFNMLEENKETIKTLATVILVALAPALINTGIQAVVTGAQVVGGFVASLVVTAAQAVVTGATITANLIGSLISYVAQGWITVANIIATTAAWLAQKAILIATSIATGIMTAAQWLLNASIQVIKIIGYTAAWLAQKAMLVLSAIATGAMTAAQWLLNAAVQIITIVAYTAAWLAQKAILIITTVATSAMTAAQWLLNAALNANPITIIVVLLVALGAAMVVAYKKSETFRNIVNEAWNSIKSTAKVVTDAVKKGWNAVTDVFDTVAKKVSGVTETIKEKWESVKTFMKNPIKGTVDIVKKGWNSLIGNNYEGTDNWKGGLTWVHEKGAEIMDLPSGTRIYPHDKSLEMARLQGQEQNKIKNQIPKVKEVTQKVRQKLESVKIPKISDVTQTIKRKVKGKPIQPFKPRNQDIIPLDRNRETKIIEKNNNKKLEITIAKLADQIVVREEADIDKITAKLVKKIEEADLNMA